MHRERPGRAAAARAAGGTLLIVLAAAALAGIVIGLGFGDRQGLGLEAAEVAADANALPSSDADPLAWDPDRREELEARAANGHSHVIYAKSPEGVVASVERTLRWRDRIEAAAERHGVDPDTLEAIVFLESAGRPEVMAGTTPEAASGLGQILPSTATDLLGMRVDLERSISLTRRIERSDDPERVNRLRRRRARIDERFDPPAALEGAARYLEIAEERFGAEDLAIASYHMGIGNLETVIRAYLGVEGGDPTGPLVDEHDLSFAQLYFDTAPDRNREAHRILSEFGDDSATYLWRVGASREIIRLYRSDREELERIARLATAKATLEEVFHPEEDTEVFDEPDDIRDALDSGELVELPDDRTLGWAPDPRIGEHADDLDQPPDLYRALRPEALATLSYMAAIVRELSGAQQPLRVTSAVRDRSYQDELIGSNPEATQAYSLHTTGWSFDVLREYQNSRQARAFQFALDRLSSLAVIDYAVEPRAIHVTVSELGRLLIDD
ncbi:MAG TPA: transglycosylase SLT domain-containing protein [Solirubrobacterales bacterium]|nr:transglycosylase SLT domain-containing protein [Solirubrobacterales bacterium]